MEDSKLKSTTRLDRKIRRAEKDLARQQQRLFRAMEKALHDGLEGDPKTPQDWDHHRRLRTLSKSVAWRAKKVSQSSEVLENLQRARDGRPTIEEDNKASAARMEARWDAEARRERDEWGLDEAKARYHSIHEQVR